MVMKTLICNIPSDRLQNEYIKDYILKQHKENNELSVLSEGAVSGESASEYDLSDELSNTTLELEKAGVKILGIDDRTSRLESSKSITTTESLISKSLSDFTKIIPKDHDESVFNYVEQAKSPFIAIVCAFHVISWISQDKLGDKYKIILPVHNKTLFELLNSPGVKKFGSEEEAAKIIGELYKQVLALPSIQVIDIDKNPLKEKEESKERSRELFSIGQGEGEEQETGVIESTSNLSSTICGSVISSASSSVISTPTIPGELVSTEIIPEISFSGESIEVQEF
jgi:hypothetical protein